MPTQTLNLHAGGNFIPSPTTRSFIPYLRKQPWQVTVNVTAPGLIGCRGFTMDTVLFMLVGVLEVIGLLVLLSTGIPGVLFVAFLFVADFLLAVVRHLHEAPICIARNKLFRLWWHWTHEPQTPKPPNVQQLYDTISKHKWLQRLWSVLIVIVALFKIGSYWAIVSEFNVGTALIILCYLTAATIHIRVTGFFFFGILYNIGFCYNRWQYEHMNPAAPNPAITVGGHLNSAFLTQKVDVLLGNTTFVDLGGVTINVMAHANPRLAPLVGELAPLVGDNHPTHILSPIAAAIPPAPNYQLRTWGILLDTAQQQMSQTFLQPDQIEVVARNAVGHCFAVLLVPG